MQLFAIHNKLEILDLIDVLHITTKWNHWFDGLLSKYTIIVYLFIDVLYIMCTLQLTCNLILLFFMEITFINVYVPILLNHESSKSGFSPL